MGYAEETTAQMTLFPEEKIPTTQPLSIPIYRVSLIREGQLPRCEHRMRSSAAASAVLREYLADTDREHFIILMLDQKNRVIGLNTVSVGSLTASVVHPREVYKPAILSNCASLILGHNHPSGDPQPSREDRAITSRLVESGRLLGISIIDHIIVGDGAKYFSFADEGLLERC